MEGGGAAMFGKAAKRGDRGPRTSRNVVGPVKDWRRRLTSGTTALILLAMTVPAGAGPAVATVGPVDVLFIFDVTGSMAGALSEAKAQVGEAITAIRAVHADSTFGIAAVSDYAPDTPWQVVQPVTVDQNEVTLAITLLGASGGGDAPEAYTRALYESAADITVGWRPDAQKLIVLVNDDMPHDNDLNEGVPTDIQSFPSPFNTGCDPGRDNICDTSDDLDWQETLALLKSEGIVFASVLYSGYGGYLPYWDWWTSSTGGATAVGGGDVPLGDLLVDLVIDGTTPKEQLRYVALGDSFSSGEGAGAGAYFQDDNGRDIKCHRAPTAWSFVLANSSSTIDDNVENAACSGAKTQHVRYEWFQGEQPQVERLRELNAVETVDLVTITIGGNDVGFGQLVRNCLFVDCTKELLNKDKKIEKMAADVIATLEDLAVAAPDAEIVLVGYPRLLPSQQSETQDCWWLEPRERIGVNTFSLNLNLALRHAAEHVAFWSAGGRISFVDVWDAFDGRELCSADSAVVRVYGNPRNSEQAHPTQEGQKLYAAAVLEGLQALNLVP